MESVLSLNLAPTGRRQAGPRLGVCWALGGAAETGGDVPGGSAADLAAIGHDLPAAAGVCGVPVPAARAEGEPQRSGQAG
jgi:hypothetical protein